MQILIKYILINCCNILKCNKISKKLYIGLINEYGGKDGYNSINKITGGITIGGIII